MWTSPFRSAAYSLRCKTEKFEAILFPRRSRRRCRRGSGSPQMHQVEEWSARAAFSHIFLHDLFVCVILHLKRHAFVIISVQYNFCMIYLLTCKHEEEQDDGGWLIRVSFDVIFVCVILHLKRHACVIISAQYNFL
jgi:hypothetical protein